MDIFWKTAAAVLIGVIVTLFLQRQGKDTALLLSLAVCAMTACVAVEFLKPLLSFLDKLREIGSLDNELFTIMLKAVGIGLICEIACSICIDSGNSAMGKTLQILGSIVIMWLSIPLLSQLITLLQKILEGL